MHSICGLIAGVALLVIGLTGSVLVFSDEVDGLFHPHLVYVQPQAHRLPYDALFRRVSEQLPGWEITRWQLHPDPAVADLARVTLTGGSNDLRAYVNPYTGEVLGKRAWSQTVAGWLLVLHESFFLGDAGTFFAGVMAALLLISGVTGVWLYRQFWRQLTRLRWRASARIFCSDLHKAVGISSVAFNLILGFTGAWWNLPVLPALWSHELPAKRAAGPMFARTVSLDALVARAPQVFPGLGLGEMMIEFPFAAGDPLVIEGRTPTGGPLRSSWGGSVKFDAQTGAVIKAADVRESGLWARIEDTFGTLHFGLFGGLPIKILWCAGGLTPGLLAGSGWMIWRARRRAARSGRGRQAGEVGPRACLPA